MDDALNRFHDRYAGASAEVFGRGLLADGRTSYDWLVEGATRGPVLDVGCGDGPLLARLDVPAVGLDRNEAELAAARERNLDHVDLVRGDVRDLPFASGRFERILSHMVLMLVPDVERVTAELDRVLAPGGTLRFVTSRRPDTRPPAMTAYLDGLNALTRTHGPAIDYPQSRWSRAALAERLPGWHLTSVPLELTLPVPVDEAGRFLRLMYYTSGLLADDGQEALDALIQSVVERHATEGVLTWTVAMRGVTARKPF